MGVDPISLYGLTHPDAIKFLRQFDKLDDFPLQEDTDWISAMLKEEGEEFISSARSSPQSGVCAFAIYIVFNIDDLEPNDQLLKQEEIVLTTKEYIEEQIGAEANKFRDGDNYNYSRLTWSGVNVQHLNSIAEVHLSYSANLTSEVPSSSIITLAYKFNNWDDCKEFHPNEE